MIKYILPLFAFILILAACEKETDYAAVDDAAIQKYLADSNLTDKATKTASGVYYIVDEQGTGDLPLTTSMVHVSYEGYLLDGTLFGKTLTNSYLKLYLDDNGYLKGFREGLKYFRKGSTGTILIPSDLAYGAKTSGSITAHSVLIYKIELLDIYN
jgi:FKBP-type peptidyl-prolyl cis-trans isomerase FkpA